MYDLFKSLIKIPHITQCVFYSTYCLTCFSNIKLISKSFNFLLLILHTHSYWLLSVIANMHPFETAVLIHFSYIWLFATLCTIAHQAPLSMGLSRQEYWSGFLSPPPEDLPGPGIEPMSPLSPGLQANSLPLSHQGGPIYTWDQPKAGS